MEVSGSSRDERLGGREHKRGVRHHRRERRRIVVVRRQANGGGVAEELAEAADTHRRDGRRVVRAVASQRHRKVAQRGLSLVVSAVSGDVADAFERLGVVHPGHAHVVSQRVPRQHGGVVATGVRDALELGDEHIVPAVVEPRSRVGVQDVFLAAPQPHGHVPSATRALGGLPRLPGLADVTRPLPRGTVGGVEAMHRVVRSLLRVQLALILALLHHALGEVLNLLLVVVDLFAVGLELPGQDVHLGVKPIGHRFHTRGLGQDVLPVDAREDPRWVCGAIEGVP